MKSIVSTFLIIGLCFSAKAQESGEMKKNTPIITCGNLIFTYPANWKLEAAGENYALILPPRYNDPERWINILVFKGDISSGDIDTDFSKAWAKYLGTYTKYQEPYLIKEKSIKGYDILRGGTNIIRGNESPLYAHLWVAKVKDKTETIIVLANNINDFDITENPEIRPFWAKLKFKNLPEQGPGDYTLKGNGIQGIYMGLQSGLDVGSGGIARSVSFLIIYNDGKIKDANKLPKNGFNAFDREVDREMNADYWGDYDLAKGNVIFNNNGHQKKFGFAYNPPKVIYNQDVFIKIPSVDGMTLSGIYSADASQTAIDAFGHEPTISFYSDGRFEDNTALYYVKSYDDMFTNPGKGTYFISNFTINLVYDDGRGSASFPFVTFDARTNSSIQIGEKIILRK